MDADIQLETLRWIIFTKRFSAVSGGSSLPGESSRGATPPSRRPLEEELEIDYLALELVQRLLPDRHPSESDLKSNNLGWEIAARACIRE